MLCKLIDRRLSSGATPLLGGSVARGGVPSHYCMRVNFAAYIHIYVWVPRGCENMQSEFDPLK